MKNTIDRIETKIDSIKEELQEMKVVQVKQENNLELHMARTEAAEKRLEIVEKNLEPIKNHVLILNTIVKIVIFLATTAFSLKKMGIF